MVHALFDLGANINARDGQDVTALQKTAPREYNDIVQILLDRADVNIQGRSYYHDAGKYLI